MSAPLIDLRFDPGIFAGSGSIVVNQRSHTLPPLHFGASGEMWRDKCSLRFLINIAETVVAVWKGYTCTYTTHKQRNCSVITHWWFRLCGYMLWICFICFLGHVFFNFSHACFLAWIQIASYLPSTKHVVDVCNPSFKKKKKKKIRLFFFK